MKACLAFLLVAAVSFGNEDQAKTISDLKNQIEQIKKSQEDIQRDLQIIKEILLGKRPRYENVVLRIQDNPALGAETAKVVLIEFSDFQCSYCGSYSRGTFRQIIDRYVTTGKLRYVYKNFPVDQLHTLARGAAEAAMCTYQQGKFWQAHDWLFDNQHALGEVIKFEDRDATEVGIDTAKFKTCVNDHKYSDSISRDIREGNDLGVRGTPTFFFGYPDPTDPSRIRLAKSLVGAASFAEFESTILDLLK